MPDRSKLGDLIVEHGPYSPENPQGELLWRIGRYAEVNALRDELIELRTVLAKVEDNQCGCLGGPLTMEWVHAGERTRGDA